MREVLVTTLILGILVSHAVALAAKPPPRGSFMFFDSSHRCWLCDPGFHCLPCPRGRIPDDWSRECNPPTPEDCAANPGVVFPDPDMRHFWRCSGSGPPSFETCPCDNVFDLDQQTCVPVDMVDSFFCNVYVNVHPNPCDPSLPTPSTPGPPTPGPPTPGPPTPGPPMPGPPTAPTIIPTTPGPPTAPTLVPTDPTNPWDTTTTTTTPWYTTTWPGPGPDTTTYSTTVGGGDDQNPPGGNVTTSTTVGEGDVQTPPGGGGNGNGTTPAPCICVIWWPCPCNPCWHFPCHSCGGCMSPGMGPGMNMMGGMGGMGMLG